MIIATVLLVIGLFLLFWGAKEDSDEGIAFGIIIVLCTVLLGFGLYGCNVPVGDPVYSKVAPTEIVIASSEVIVKFKHGETMGEVRDNTYINMVNAKSNNVTVLVKDTKNSYGRPLTPVYSLIIKE